MLSYLIFFFAKITIGDAWSLWPALSALLPSWPSRSHKHTGGLPKRFVQLMVFLLMLIWTRPASAELWPSPRRSWVDHLQVVATPSALPTREASNGEATVRVQVTNSRFERFELTRLADPTYGDLGGSRDLRLAANPAPGTPVHVQLSQAGSQHGRFQRAARRRHSEHHTWLRADGKRYATSSHFQGHCLIRRKNNITHVPTGT